MIFVFFIMISGCAKQRGNPVVISNDLLIQEYVIESPFPNAVKIQVPQNPKVKSYWNVEKGMADALSTALAYSNLFGTDQTKTYEIIAEINNIEMSSEAAGFGNITVSLDTHYTLYDSERKIIFETDVRSNADNYRYHFEAYERLKKAHARSVAANVNQFVGILRNRFGRKVNSSVHATPKSDNETTPQKNVGTSPINKGTHAENTLAESLEKLSQLHIDGHLSDAEFQQAKEKLLNEL